MKVGGRAEKIQRQPPCLSTSHQALHLSVVVPVSSSSSAFVSSTILVFLPVSVLSSSLKMS